MVGPHSKLVKEHGKTLISALRKIHGRSFALGMPGNNKLTDVIHQLDERSLAKLAREARRMKSENSSVAPMIIEG
jgi:hypothetical protein